MDDLRRMQRMLSVHPAYENREQSELNSIHTRMLALKLAEMQLSKLDTITDSLLSYYKKKKTKEFATLYKEHCCELERNTFKESFKRASKIINNKNGTDSFVNFLPSSARCNILNFLDELRNSPEILASALNQLPEHELENFCSPDAYVYDSPHPFGIVDSILHLFGVPEHSGEKAIKGSFFQNLFVEFVPNSQHNGFLVKFLLRLFRFPVLKPGCLLESKLIKIIRKSEKYLDIIEKNFSSLESWLGSFSQESQRPQGVKGKEEAEETREIETQNFIDSSCVELLKAFEPYIPEGLIQFAHSLFLKLDKELFQQVVKLFVVDFLLRHLLGRLVVYPEVAGIFNGYFISSRQRKLNLKTLYQRIYSLAIEISNEDNQGSFIDCHLASQIRALMAKFSPDVPKPGFIPDSSSKSGLSSFTSDSVHLLPEFYESVTPTIYLSQAEIVSFHDLIVNRQVRKFEGPSKARKIAFAKLEPFDAHNAALTQALVIEEIRGLSGLPTILYVSDNGLSYSCGELQLEYDEAYTSLSGSDNTSQSSRNSFLSVMSEEEIDPEFLRDLCYVREALFLILENFALDPLSAQYSDSVNLENIFSAAIMRFRAIGSIYESVFIQHALEMVKKFPENYQKYNYSSLLSLILRTMEHNKSRKEIRSQSRNVWLAYTYNLEKRMKEYLQSRVAILTDLRMRMFFSGIRETKLWVKLKDTSAELAERKILTEYEIEKFSQCIVDPKSSMLPLHNSYNKFCQGVNDFATRLTEMLGQHELFTFEEISGYPLQGEVYNGPKAHSKCQVSRLSFSTILATENNFAEFSRLKIVSFALSELQYLFGQLETDMHLNEFSVKLVKNEATRGKINHNTTNGRAGFMSTRTQKTTDFLDFKGSRLTVSGPIGISPPEDQPLLSTLCYQFSCCISPLEKLKIISIIEKQLSSTQNHMDTDTIILSFENLFLNLRPRHLFRSIQEIQIFIPAIFKDASHIGKAFIDVIIAANSLHDRLLDFILQRGRRILRELEETAKIKKLTESYVRQREKEAFRMFEIGAREGSPEAMRELAIQYLSLPYLQIENGSIMSFESFPNNTNSKFIAQNVKQAYKWFQEAAAKGDELSKEYLKSQPNRSA